MYVREIFRHVNIMHVHILSAYTMTFPYRIHHACPRNLRTSSSHFQFQKAGMSVTCVRLRESSNANDFLQTC